MKKIIGILLAGALVTSAFAADFNARVNLAAEVIGGTIKTDNSADAEFHALKFANNDQKDGDLIEAHFSGDMAGADFKIWAKAVEPSSYYFNNGEGAFKVGGQYGTNMNILSLRGLGLWFKPIDMLKINVGYVTYGTFCEHTGYWKAVPGQAINADDWGGYSSYATVDGFGAMVTFNPIAGLEFNAGVTPGGDNSFFTVQGSNNNTSAWGAAVKADLNSFAEIPVVAAVSFRDAGKDAAKILAIGASYGQENSGLFYGFINARLKFEKMGDAFEMTTVTLDNWFKFTVDKLGIQLAVPVVLRTYTAPNVSAEAKNLADPHWMLARLKVTYNMGAFTPYLYAETTRLAFNEKLGESFGILVKPGVSFNVGSCALDIAASFGINRGIGDGVAVTKDTLTWAVPVTFAVSF